LIQDKKEEKEMKKFKIYFKRRISGYYKVSWMKEQREVEAETLVDAISIATRGLEVKSGSIQYEELR